MEAIEDWPTELHGIPPIETQISGDGMQRVRFCRRADGMIQFFSQVLRRCETEGQEYFVWYVGPVSGIYPDLDVAKKDAIRLVPWLENLE